MARRDLEKASWMDRAMVDREIHRENDGDGWIERCTERTSNEAMAPSMGGMDPSSEGAFRVEHAGESKKQSVM